MERGKVDPAIRRFFFVTGAFSGVPSGAVEIVAELGDELLDIVRLAPELGGALTLGRDHAFRLGLLFLALIDQRGQPLAVIGECCEIALEAGALGGDAGAQPCQFAEIGDEGLGLLPHLRQHSTEQHR